VRYLLAPQGTATDQDFIDCRYEVMDVGEPDSALPNFLALDQLQCPVVMSARQKADLPKRRIRWIRKDYKKNLAAVWHCIQRFTGELMSESDDEIPFTVQQRDAARSTGVLPSADEVHLQKQQLLMAERDLY
jgi:hypothetical protein